MTRVTYSEEYKNQVLKRANEVGIEQAAKEFNIEAQGIYWWINKAKKTTDADYNTAKYTEEFKKEVLERAEDVGIKKAAFEYSLLWLTVSTWRQKKGAGAEGTAVNSKQGF